MFCQIMVYKMSLYKASSFYVVDPVFFFFPKHCFGIRYAYTVFESRICTCNIYDLVLTNKAKNNSISSFISDKNRTN